MSTPFQQPAEAGDKVPMAELTGSLVLFDVREHRTGLPTVHGEKDAIACDVHVLDGKHGGEVFGNALLFQGGLIGALKHAIGGGPVLGRVALGTAKAGQNAPYMLLPFTAQDAALAGPYWASVQAKGFQAPAAAAPAPAPAPVQQEATAAQANAVMSASAPGTVDLSQLPENVRALILASIPS